MQMLNRLNNLLNKRKFNPNTIVYDIKLQQAIGIKIYYSHFINHLLS